MNTDDQVLAEREIESAVDLLDQLLQTTDGGREVVLGQYEASTILALLMDKMYREIVMLRLHDFADLVTDE